jgi:hypothetical protein
MNFIEAIKAIKRNENLSVKRKETIVSYYECFDKLYVDAKYQSELELFVPSVDDILAEDWYVVKNEKLHTFEEAIVAFKEGKTIKRASCYNKHNPTDKQFIVTTDSILADDWIIMGKED